jgi:hypothetical protein
VAAPIADSADAKAGMAVAALRAKIRDLGDFAGAHEAIKSLSAVVWWQELIHTSYFEHASIVNLIAGHVRDFSTYPNSDSKQDDPLDDWLRARPRAGNEPVVRRKQNVAIPIAGLARTVGTIMLLGLAAATSYSAWVAPLTARSQVDQIARKTFESGLSAVQDSDMQAEAVVRLMALGKIPDLEKALSRIHGPQLTQERIAYAVGFASGQMPEFGLEDYPAHPRHQRSGADEIDAIDAVRIRFASALSISRKPIPEEIIAKLADVQRYATQQVISGGSGEDDIVTASRDLSAHSRAMILEAAAVLYANGRAADGTALLDFVDDYEQHKDPCSNALKVSIRLSIRGFTAINRLADRCMDANRRREIYYLAALEAQQAGQVSVASELFLVGAPLTSDSLTVEQLWHTIAILIGLDRIDEAVAWTHRLMQQWKQHPSDAMDGRVVVLTNRFRSKRKSGIGDWIVNEMLQVFTGSETESASGGYCTSRGNDNYVECVTEAAKILISENKSADLLAFARQVESLDAKGNFVPHLAAASIYKVGGFYANARDELVSALNAGLQFDFGASEDDFNLACKIVSIGSSLRVCPKTSGRITKFSEHEAD